MDPINSVPEIIKNYSILELAGIVALYFLLDRLGILDLIPKRRGKNKNNNPGNSNPGNGNIKEIRKDLSKIKEKIGDLTTISELNKKSIHGLEKQSRLLFSLKDAYIRRFPDDDITRI